MGATFLKYIQDGGISDYNNNRYLFAYFKWNLYILLNL